MSTDNIIEFSGWATPFEEGELQVVGLDWGFRRMWLGDKMRYELEMPTHEEDYELVIKVFHLPTESVYEIKFPSADTFRVLDEGGLLSIWSAKEWRKYGKNTVKVRGHEWSVESPLSFFHNSNDGWSFLIATSMECVEIVTTSEPDIIFIEKIELKDAGEETLD